MSCHCQRPPSLFVATSTKGRYVVGQIAKGKTRCNLPWKQGWGYLILTDFNVVTLSSYGLLGITFTRALRRFLTRFDQVMLYGQNSFCFDCDGGRFVQLSNKVTLSNHQPIWFVVSLVGEKMRMYKNHFSLNISHLKSLGYNSCIKRIWNMLSMPRKDEGWIVWWGLLFVKAWASSSHMATKLLMSIISDKELLKSWNMSLSFYKTMRRLAKDACTST